MKRWYVVQVYAGYEETIKTDLLKSIREAELEGFFGDVLVPSAKVKQLFDVSSNPKVDQQLFPGYLLIEMELAQEAMRLVLSTPRVTKFLGGKDPVPLSSKEIDRVLSQIKGEVAVASKKSDFVVGNEIEISEGPFAGFVGIIHKVEEEVEKLTVMVSIFGRMTPVELAFDQIKR